MQQGVYEGMLLHWRCYSEPMGNCIIAIYATSCFAGSVQILPVKNLIWHLPLEAYQVLYKMQRQKIWVFMSWCNFTIHMQAHTNRRKSQKIVSRFYRNFDKDYRIKMQSL